MSSFLARECPGRSVTGARDLVCALSSLLRCLHLAGLIRAPLVWAVPSIADLRDRTLPRGLDPAAVHRLLASCDRRTLAGLRDYAILLLLARLGLRVGEIAGLRLGGVDWRHGELLVIWRRLGAASRGGLNVWRPCERFGWPLRQTMLSAAATASSLPAVASPHSYCRITGSALSGSAEVRAAVSAGREDPRPAA